MKTTQTSINLNNKVGARKNECFSWRHKMVRVAFLTLVLALSLAPISSPVFAQEQPATKDHEFKFYLDSALVTDIDRVKEVLPKYVADLNTILAKNTDRRLIFDPEIDIILTTTQPFSNQASYPLPDEDFEIWAQIVQSEVSYSYGGYAGVDASGAGVLAGLKWVEIYDPDTLTPAALTDYWTQINNLLHEMAHVFGAGMGEYYRLALIQDTTGVAPYLNINFQNPADSFWSDKPDFMADPLLQNAAKIENLSWLQNRTDLLDYVKYSNLTAAIMSGNYRNALPSVDLQNITFRVVDEAGVPLADAATKIWSVVGNTPYSATLMADTATDSLGLVTFAWGGSKNPHNNYDFLRLIKVYKDGYIATAKYVSIFDADIVKLVQERDALEILITMRADSEPPVIASIDRTNLDSIGTATIEYAVTFTEPVAGVDLTDFYLESTGISSALVRSIQGSGSVYSVIVETGSGTGTLRLNVVDNDTIVDAVQNPLGGVGQGNGSYASAEFYIRSTTKIYLPTVSKP